MNKQLSFTMHDEDLSNGASFSQDMKFRYSLWRTWDEELKTAAVFGLNPSTANASKNDATIRILIKALTLLGFGGFTMLNCFPIISSDPRILNDVDIDDEYNRTNQEAWRVESSMCTEVIFGWGAHTIVSGKGIDKLLINMFPAAKCFCKNLDGTPMHPMSLMWTGKINNPELIPFN